MEKNVNLNNANVFENSKFDDLENENFENLFVNKKIASKQTNTQKSMSKNEIKKKHRLFQFLVNFNRKRIL